MKTKLLLLLISLTLFSCAPNTPNSHSEKELKKAKTEIKNMAQNLFAASENLDLNAALKDFVDAPDFVYITNGVAYNYDQMAKAMKPIFEEMADQKFNITKEKISFPSRLVAVYTAEGNNVMHYKNGTTVTLDPYVLSFIFKKFGDQWKVIYGAESYIEKPVDPTNKK